MTEKIRTSLAWVFQQLIEAELTSAIGAAPHERTENRTALRNGHRPNRECPTDYVTGAI